MHAMGAGWTAMLLVVGLGGCYEDSRCVEASRAALVDPGDPLVIGGTYGEVLATVVGERSGTLEWQPSEQHVRGFPAPGSVGLTVTVGAPLEAWNVDEQRQGGHPQERLACLGTVEVLLPIELRTDDGVLEVTVSAPATLWSTSTVDIVADLGEVPLGMLTFDPIDEDASLWLELSLGAPTGSGGALRLSTAPTEDPDSIAGAVALATWSLE